MVEISLVLAQSNLWVPAGHSICPTTLPSLPCFHPSSELISFVRSTKNNSSSEIRTQFGGSWWVLPSMEHSLAAGSPDPPGLWRARPPAAARPVVQALGAECQQMPPKNLGLPAPPCRKQTLLAPWAACTAPRFQPEAIPWAPKTFHLKLTSHFSIKWRGLEAFPAAPPARWCWQCHWQRKHLLPKADLSRLRKVWVQGHG